MSDRVKKLQRQIEEAQESLKKAQEELERMKENSKEFWEPSRDDVGFAVTADGTLLSGQCWTLDRIKRMSDQGNVFPTIESARYELKRRTLVQKMRKAASVDPVSEDNACVIFAEYYDESSEAPYWKVLQVDIEGIPYSDTPVFYSEQTAKKFIKEHEEELKQFLSKRPD